jgi:hypothetical protein
MSSLKYTTNLKNIRNIINSLCHSFLPQNPLLLRQKTPTSTTSLAKIQKKMPFSQFTTDVLRLKFNQRGADIRTTKYQSFFMNAMVNIGPKMIDSTDAKKEPLENPVKSTHESLGVDVLKLRKIIYDALSHLRFLSQIKRAKALPIDGHCRDAFWARSKDQFSTSTLQRIPDKNWIDERGIS